MYEKLADYYDIFMYDVPYDEWCEYLTKYLPKNGVGMDIGCGTGAFTIRLVKNGYDVTGVDISPQMLRIAQNNAKKERLAVNFALSGAENFTTHHALDFITANCDVVNYLKNPRKFFARAYQKLNDNGVFIFDISSAFKLKNVLGNQVYTENRNEVTYIWENFYDEKRRKVDMKLTFFAPNGNGLYEKSEDEQTQFIHETNDLLGLLTAVGFKKVEVFGFLSQNQPKASEERIHFIAYKYE
ncbi:MAG: class I SAM-dependent methyltransferase [Clostridia bacterium]|nr:class I SAM-dependent methyltransferase [Clostridia bacterium]